jgi:alkanesulfonate monooxygenase SsuD/methylene tetrahydromethanopterin reductase-like flavin-dependent oxidoreductase (luciferase family)
VADGVLFNWLTPEHALRSADWVRAGAEAAGRPTPRLAAYVRVAIGPESAARLEEEGRAYAGIPAYADHFARMGVPAIRTAVAVESEIAVPDALTPWERALNDVVVRAITARDTVDETLALIRAARPR